MDLICDCKNESLDISDDRMRVSRKVEEDSIIIGKLSVVNKKKLSSELYNSRQFQLLWGAVTSWVSPPGCCPWTLPMTFVGPGLTYVCMWQHLNTSHGPDMKFIYPRWSLE